MKFDRRLSFVPLGSLSAHHQAEPILSGDYALDRVTSIEGEGLEDVVLARLVPRLRKRITLLCRLGGSIEGGRIAVDADPKLGGPALAKLKTMVEEIRGMLAEEIDDVPARLLSNLADPCPGVHRRNLEVLIRQYGADARVDGARLRGALALVDNDGGELGTAPDQAEVRPHVRR